MPIICWGSLAKSADDNTRIEQAIAEYIETHDENPNAHMGADYSLGAHRLATELDHISGSVAFHHLVMDSYNAMISFESFDGWILEGNGSAGILGATIYTDAGAPDDTASISSRQFSGGGPDASKNPFFQATVSLVNNTDQTGHIILGNLQTEDDSLLFGFKYTNSTLYAYWRDAASVDHTHEISGVDVIGNHCYRAQRDSTLDKTYFYVDGVLKYTLNGDLYVGAQTGFAEFYIKKTGGVSQRTMFLIDFLFQMDR